MTCKHCGVEMENNPNGSLALSMHPGGPCPEQPFVMGGTDFTLAEVQALKRVAQAQLEMEERRGRNG